MADTQTPQGPLTERLAGLAQRVRKALTPPPRPTTPASAATRTGATRTGATTQVERSPMRKLLKGFLFLLLGVYAWQFFLLFLDTWLKGALTHSFPFGQGGLGGVFNLYFILLTIGFLGYWWVLRRYDILPGANAQRRAATATPPTPATPAHQTRKERKDANKAARDEARAHMTVTGEYDDIHERMRAQRRRS